MPLLRSQLCALIEGTILGLGWALAPADRELIAASPSTSPLQVVWRWVRVDTTPDVGKPGGPGQPMSKVMTWAIEYAAQVHSSVKADKQYKYLAADVPDMLAAALLDRNGTFMAGVRNVQPNDANGIPGRANFVLQPVIGTDVMIPPASINANGQVSGQLSFSIRVEIDARTDLAITVAEEGV